MGRGFDLFADIDGVSPEMGWKLLDPLLRDRASSTFDAVAFVALGAVAFAGTGSPWYLAGAALVALAAAGRLRLGRRYEQAAGSATLRQWAARATIGAWAAGAASGAWGAVALWEPAPTLSVVVIAVQCTAALIAAVRQHSLPAAAAGQSVLTLVPTLAACLATGEGEISRFTGIVAISLAAALALVWLLHRQTLRLLRTNEELTRLAGRLDLVTQDRDVVMRHLETMVVTDALTGLANRRALDLALAREWRRGVREQSPLSLLLLGLDDFPEFTAQYGATSGEACLREVSAVAGTAVRRPGDAVARYGEEHFAVVLPGTWGEGAAHVAGQVLAAIAARGLEHASSPLGRVTASIGVACLIPQSDDGADRLMALAETALETARGGGRNRVQVAATYDMAIGGQAKRNSAP